MKKIAGEYYNQESVRLQYRPLQVEHIENWSCFFVDNPSDRFIGASYLGSTPKEKAKAWIEKQIERKAKGQYGQLAIIEKSSGAFIGLGGIIEREMNPGVDFEVTYSFLPEYWGKGYATELAVHFKNFAFNYIETNSVISMIHKDNLASINVAQKNGMAFASRTTFLNMPILVYRAFRE